MAERPTDEPGHVLRHPVKETSNVSEDARDRQRRDALRLANAKRSLHAALKRELAELPIMESRGLAGHVIRYDRERFDSIRLGVLLKAIRGWGPEKTRRICQRAGVSERRRLIEISDVEAKKIAAMLAEQQLKGRDE